MGMKICNMAKSCILYNETNNDVNKHAYPYESSGNVMSGSSSETDATLALFLFASCIKRFELSIIFHYIWLRLFRSQLTLCCTTCVFGDNESWNVFFGAFSGAFFSLFDSMKTRSAVYLRQHQQQTGSAGVRVVAWTAATRDNEEQRQNIYTDATAGHVNE
jgi:hypothetical protein